MTLSRFFRRALVWAVLGAAFPAVFGGCAGTTDKTAFMESQENVAMGASELRVRLYDYANNFSGAVEMTADEIAAATDDPVIQRRTLQWKISAIAEVYRAVFGSDPLGAYTDVWAFSKQMHHFLDTGPGKDLFGDRQADAVATARDLERRAHAMGQLGSVSGDVSKLENKLENWVGNHPLKDLGFIRESTTPLWAEYASESGGGFAMVGRMEVSLHDLLARVDILSENLRKQARWETQLLMGEAMADGEFGEFLARVDSIEVNIDRIRLTLDDLEPILARQVAALMITGGELAEREMELAREMWAVERDTLFARMAAIQAETFALLAAERALILQEVEASAGRTVDRSLERTRSLIDHLVWRLAQLVAGGILVLALLVFGAWRFRSRKGSA